MLHELFLLLAGHPSPLFKPKLPDAFPFVSPSERALLNELAQLGILHRQLRIRCDLITSVHPSTVARATASGILTILQRFRQQISETEQLVLKRDDSVVGAYDIVPLAKIAALFTGWLRILQYLEELVTIMVQGSMIEEDNKKKDEQDLVEIDNAAEISMIKEKGIRGAKLINKLREDIHTGFPSIEKVALELLNIAEMAWLRQISTWVLYGRLPTFGASDFMIREATDIETEENASKLASTAYMLNKSNVPDFVTSATASSILFIGRALSQIYEKGKGGSMSMAANLASDRVILSQHIALLQSLTTPLSSALFHSAISSIRDSLSKNTLQNLLPPEQIRETIRVLRQFYLLGRGEFSVALVEQADEKVRGRWRRTGVSTTNNPSLSGVVIKDGEVSGVLKRTWTTLSSFQNEEELDELLERAKGTIFFSLKKAEKSNDSSAPASEVKTNLTKKEGSAVFNDILLGVPISINFNLNWPLELFLTPQDLDTYESLFHYLLVIRRASIKLQSLWQSRRNTALHGIATSGVKDELKRKRELLRDREKVQRAAWATANLCIFFLESLGVYFQSNVIETSFNILENLVSPTRIQTKNPYQERKLDGDSSQRTPLTTTSLTTKRPTTPSSRPSTSSSPFQTPSKTRIEVQAQLTSTNSSPRPHTKPAGQVDGTERNAVDPETLTLAHHQYLQGLTESVFLNDVTFTNLLREFLIQCDVMVTQLSAMHNSNQMVDIIENDGNTEDDKRALGRLGNLCYELRKMLSDLHNRLQEMDEQRSRDDTRFRRSMREERGKSSFGMEQHSLILEGALAAAGIDKLLMKLDLGSLQEA